MYADSLKASPRILLWSSVPKGADGPGVPTRGEGVWRWKSSSRPPLIPPVLPTWGLRRVKSNLLLLFVCESVCVYVWALDHPLSNCTVSLDCFPAIGKAVLFTSDRGRLFVQDCKYIQNTYGGARPRPLFSLGWHRRWCLVQFVLCVARLPKLSSYYFGWPALLFIHSGNSDG